MSTDAILIAKSILMLRTDIDYIKDYIFPVALSFFSALLGGLTAYYISAKQEQRKAELEKFYAANSLMMLSFQLLNTLIAIKSNYIGMKETNPILRAFSINELLFSEDQISFDISKLSFIKRSPTANKPPIERIAYNMKYKILKKTIPTPSTEELSKSWRNIARVDVFISNYNFVLRSLHVRNELDAYIRGKIAENLKSETPILEANFEYIVKLIGAPKISKYIDLTETIIALIDFLIKEADSFLINFPKIAESNIELSKINDAKIATITLDKPAYLAALIPIIKPDMALISKNVGMSETEALRRYTYNNWN